MGTLCKKWHYYNQTIKACVAEIITGVGAFYVSLKITIQMCSMQERFTHIKSQRIELLLVMGTSTFTGSTCAPQYIYIYLYRYIYISFYSDAVNELV